jgi:hypothetical protein
MSELNAWLAFLHILGAAAWLGASSWPPPTWSCDLDPVEE